MEGRNAHDFIFRGGIAIWGMSDVSIRPKQQLVDSEGGNTRMLQQGGPAKPRMDDRALSVTSFQISNLFMSSQYLNPNKRAISHLRRALPRCLVAFPTSLQTSFWMCGFCCSFWMGRGQKAIPARRKNRNTFSQLLTKRKATQRRKLKP
jgi:hypothetical protein